MENGRAVPVLVVVALSGVKVCDPEDQSVRMCHALRRISYATCEARRALFALVAREPRSEPPHHYCHAFQTDTPEQASNLYLVRTLEQGTVVISSVLALKSRLTCAELSDAAQTYRALAETRGAEELNSLVGDAFRMAFASQLQPSAPLWSKELSGSDCGMGVRAPDSLPGLTHHYCSDRSPAKCNTMGVMKLVNEPSPSSSEESNSPTEMNCYRRLGERPPLMKRLAMGLSGALLQPSDDDSTPLVADTPTTPTNLPLCMNGGYINEASEAEARTRESNREPPAVPAAPRRTEQFLHSDLDVDFRRCNNLKNSESGACSRTTSSSSGASSCGGVPTNNNIPRAEPELRQAPWFQHGIPREIALEVLSSQAVGAFLVRGSTTQTGCFALSVRVPRDFTPAGIAHYLILRTPKGYKIKGFTKEFTSLCALVTHHSVMPELLPVPLRLPRAARAPPARRDHADLDALTHAHTHPRAHPPHPAHHPHHAQPPHHFLAQLDV
ncbi:unnamed protein product [Chrysodeixis includens]|uniref:SH2 domain-containing protein n=1 Tax=Chrysodeixis includens TaxID=689277 RepID=A0A9N8KVA3_CHRIL|nr:unnamed protein product [Chrysodeixis includens]